MMLKYVGDYILSKSLSQRVFSSEAVSSMQDREDKRKDKPGGMMREGVTQAEATNYAKAQKRKGDGKIRGMERYVIYQSAISVKMPCNKPPQNSATFYHKYLFLYS